MFNIILSVVLSFIKNLLSQITFLRKFFVFNTNGHPDAGLNLFKLIDKHGYTVERHGNIQTEDGYILEMHRIPNGLKNKGITNKVPVLLMHGVMGSSADWVISGPQGSLAYHLADIGYDVWMGNTRGNVWSKKHKLFDPVVDKKQFWNFSFHEMGLYDATAKIDYICKATGFEKIYYVGYSHGSVAFFAMTSEKPEYNAKIRLAVLMGPYTKSKNMYNPVFQIVAKHEKILNSIHKWLDRFVVFPPSKIYLLVARIFDMHPFLQKIMALGIFFTLGFDQEQHNYDLQTVIATHYPSGCSLRQIVHILQCIKNDSFRRYDYNSAYKNIRNYGQPVPPDYNLKNITAPLSLNYGKNDWLLSVEDVERLKEILPNVVHDNKIAYDKFNHLDFIYAKNIFELLYDDVIKIMKKY